MKKNITINLCGRLYQIDEDAYELLSHYTDTLRNYFMKQEGGAEIADDIEQRISELFDELKSQGIEAITIEHVQGVIDQIGNVEQIAGDGQSEEADAQDSTANANADQTQKEKKEYKPTATKKFFRDPGHKVLAGVLAGCANYFGGSANGWRWGYVVFLALYYAFGSSVGMSIFNAPFFALVSFVFALPLSLLPFIPYILAAIFAPEAQSAEDYLKMKGEEVTPENLVKEVKEKPILPKPPVSSSNGGSDFWDILVGILSLGFIVLFGLSFLAIFCAIIFLAAVPSAVGEYNSYEYVVPAICAGIALLVSTGILLYCSIHAAISSFRGKGKMSNKQRVLWLVAWLIALFTSIGFTIYSFQKFNQYESHNSFSYGSIVGQTRNIVDQFGHYFDQEEWNYFQEEGWELIRAENTSRFTSSGEYMTGDDGVLYLDAWNDRKPVVYRAQKTEVVEPGVYRLSAVVRTDGVGKFIFVEGQKMVGMEKDSIDGDSMWHARLEPVEELKMRMKEFPVEGNEGGNIWKTIAHQKDQIGTFTDSNMNFEPALYQPDSLVQQYVNSLEEWKRDQIFSANWEKGYGWNYICIDNIVVKNQSQITYGVNVPVGKSATGWFSATDFVLEKISDLK